MNSPSNLCATNEKSPTSNISVLYLYIVGRANYVKHEHEHTGLILLNVQKKSNVTENPGRPLAGVSISLVVRGSGSQEPATSLTITTNKMP